MKDTLESFRKKTAEGEHISAESLASTLALLISYNQRLINAETKPLSYPGVLSIAGARESHFRERAAILRRSFDRRADELYAVATQARHPISEISRRAFQADNPPPEIQQFVNYSALLDEYDKIRENGEELPKGKLASSLVEAAQQFQAVAESLHSSASAAHGVESFKFPGPDEIIALQARFAKAYVMPQRSRDIINEVGKSLMAIDSEAGKKVLSGLPTTPAGDRASSLGYGRGNPFAQQLTTSDGMKL